jgi:glucose/arabinose dehydrogenase
VTFNTLASSRDPDFGLLYIGSADGGAGGDPHNMSQNLQSAFGKILRIDPFGSNSANGKYGIPTSNPFVKSDRNALREIYACGIRNVQRIFWDAKTKRMFVADIGQNAVEEISPVTPGANLGWNIWEGSYKFAGRGRVWLADPRSDSKMTYPVVEYDHDDPTLWRRMAIIGGFVYRHKAIPQLTGKLLFADNPSGEILYVDADHLPEGGHDAIRRILFDENGTSKTLLELMRAKIAAQGKAPTERADMRFGEGPDGKIFILNKHDNVIRMLVPNARK